MTGVSDLLGALGRLRKTDTVVTSRDGTRSVQNLLDGTVKANLERSATFGLQQLESLVITSRWSPLKQRFAFGSTHHAQLSPCSTLVVFDFDCTLTVEHMYHTLRSREGQERLAAEPTRFYESMFGGAERVQRLRHLLRHLQATGATVVVLSNGITLEIEAALRSVGLRGLFWKVMGGEDQLAARVASKAAMLARLCFQADVGDGRGFAHVLFVDDDRDNFPSHEAALTTGAAWRLETGAEGGQVGVREGTKASERCSNLQQTAQCPVTTLIAWPAGACEGGAGLPSDDMDAIAAAFARPPPPPPIGEAAFRHVDDPTRAWEMVRCGQSATVLPTARFIDPGPKAEGAVRFVCISDTHSRVLSEALPEGDVLLHAGDFSNTGRPEEIAAFAAWFSSQPHRRKLVIAGNHDLTFDPASYAETHGRFGHPKMYDAAATRKLLEEAAGVEYLCDACSTVDGVTVWGSPWQPEFGGWAFNLPRGEPCRERWRRIPAGVDVVMTHGPALGHGDLCSSGHRAGCLDLLHELQSRVSPRFHVAGHVHEGYGATTDGTTTFLNASTCTLRYKPDNKPLVFDVMPRGRSGELELPALQDGQNGEASAAQSPHELV